MSDFVTGSHFDVLVLGAGMVGSASAAHLALRGLKIGLVDRQEPGEGTSYGNAGVIDASALMPTVFPRHLPTLMKYTLGLTPHLNFHPSFLPRVSGWLYRYYRESAPDRILASAERVAPLARHAVAEHHALAELAGARALIRDTGWLHVYRGKASFAADAVDRDLMQRFGIELEVADEARLAELEPHLTSVAYRGVLVKGASSTSNPGALTKAYAALATAKGGQFVTADAGRLTRTGAGWQLPSREGTVTAGQVVVALGPWAKEFLARFGVDVPIAVKRGYHMHFSGKGNATLNRPVHDAEGGYAITPMAKGIRMTTGAEFADRDAPPTPVQIDRAEAMARTLFPLDQRVEAEPWLGRRPNTPDSVPIIGPAPGQRGMWLAVGHGHWGLGFGAATGRLIADLVTGVTPLVDPKPLGLERFG